MLSKWVFVKEQGISCDCNCDMNITFKKCQNEKIRITIQFQVSEEFIFNRFKKFTLARMFSLN